MPEKKKAYYTYNIYVLAECVIPLCPSFQQLVSERELEASEHRVQVMTADIASLQRRLAEHGNVIRRAQVLAEKVTKTHTDTHVAVKMTENLTFIYIYIYIHIAGVPVGLVGGPRAC